MPGPVPKRSEMTRRRNKPEIDIATASSGESLDWGELEDYWPQYAKDWYESLQKSGQSIFYQQTDVAQARYICHLMWIVDEQDIKPNAQLVAAIFSGMADLLTSEGQRRRVRIEIAKQEDEGPSAPVFSLEQLRKQAAGMEVSE